MAAPVIVDIPGIGSIEAKNAATEQTLRELVNAIKGLKKGQDQQEKTGTKDKGPDTKAQKEYDKQIKENSKSLKDQTQSGKRGIQGLNELGKAGRAAGNLLGTFGQSVGMAARGADFLGAKMMGAAEAATRMIQDLANVGDSLTSAANSLNNIPVVGGVLAGVFGAVAGAVEKTAGAYQSAASVGATFGGSVTEMTRAASSAGMTLDQFANLLKSNGQNLMLLGGTTEEGAKRLTQLSKSMKQSGLESELLRMGYSTSEVNDGILKFAGFMGKTGALQNMSTAQLVKGSAAYLKEMDALAKVTGEERSAKQAQVDALMSEGKVRAALAGIEDPEQQRKMMAYITSFPKEAQGAIADMIATGSVTSEEAVKFAAMMPKAAEQAMTFGRTLQAGGKINDASINQARNTTIMEARESVKRNKQLGQFAGDFSATFVAVANTASQEINGYSKAIQEQAKATQKANLAEQAEKAKQRLAAFSNSFLSFLANSGMLDAMLTAFEALASFATAVLMPVFSLLTQAINMLIPIVQNTIIPAFTILGNWIKDAVVPIFQQAFQVVSNVVTGLLDFFGISQSATSGLGTFENILYAVSDFVEDNLTPVLGVLGFMIASKVVVALTAMLAPVISLTTTIGGLLINMVKFSFQILASTIRFIAMNIPLFKLTLVIGAAIAVFKGIQWIMKKLGVDTSMIGDLFKYAGAMFESLWLKLKWGIYSLLDWIPGIDMGDELKEVEKQMLENEEKRAQIEDDFKKKREKNLADESRKQQQQDDEESEADKKQREREEARKRRDEERARRQSEKEHTARMGGIAQEQAAKEEAAASETDMAVDLSDPLQMLKSFAEKNKSAFTQEAKALDEKDRARNELAMASDAYTTAMKQAANAKTKEEKQLAEAAIKAAEDRMKSAQKAQEDADKKVTEAAARMKSAREGKDTGPPRADRRAGTASTTPSATGRPTEPEKAPKIMGDQFGKIAAQFEAGGKAGTISTGHGDFGGKSYGAFQLASKTGDVDKFLKESGYAEQFKGLKVGSEAFDAKWKEMAKSKDFEKAQYAHAKKTHYDPQAQKLARSGMDLSGRGEAVQEAIMSTANQYGANTDLIIKALKDKNVDKMSDKDIINAIQDYKADTVKQRFRSSSKAVQEGVAKRIEQERSALLGLEPGTATAAGRASPQTARTPTSSEVATATRKEESAQEKLQREKNAKLAEYDAAAKNEPRVSSMMPGAPAQESAESLLAQLNSKMDALIAVSRKTADLNDQQLSTQKGMVGNLYA